MTTFRGLRALRWLADHPQVTELPQAVVPVIDAEIVYDELRDLDAIAETRTLGGSFEFLLTATGRVLARNAVHIYRAELAQRRVLAWVKQHNSLDGLVSSVSGEDFTGALTYEEVADAATELVGAELLIGHRRADGEFFHLEITGAGLAALRNPNQIVHAADALRSNVTNIASHNYGTMTVGNQVLGGSRHSMTATVSQGASLAEVMQAIQQLRNDIAAAEVGDPVAREEVLEEIDAVLEKGPRRGLSWVKATLDAVAIQLASSIGEQFAEQALQIALGL